MKKKIGLLLACSFLLIPLLFSSGNKVSALEWDGSDCQPGFFWKKGGFAGAFGDTKSGGYCVPMGNAYNGRPPLKWWPWE